MTHKIQTLSIPVSPEVAAFAVVMEVKLQMEGFDQVERWENLSFERLMSQLESKAKRLLGANQADLHSIFAKAVVLGNLAMMIAEKAAKLKEGLGRPVDAPLVEEPVVLSPMQLSGPSGIGETDGPLGFGSTKPHYARMPRGKVRLAYWDEA